MAACVYTYTFMCRSSSGWGTKGGCEVVVVLIQCPNLHGHIDACPSIPVRLCVLSEVGEVLCRLIASTLSVLS